MKKIIFIFGLLSLFLEPVWAEPSACLPTLTPFTCKDSSGKILINRCAINRGCYDLQEGGQKHQCCPVQITTDTARGNVVKIIKERSIVKIIFHSETWH